MDHLRALRLGEFLGIQQLYGIVKLTVYQIPAIAPFLGTAFGGLLYELFLYTGMDPCFLENTPDRS